MTTSEWRTGSHNHHSPARLLVLNALSDLHGHLSVLETEESADIVRSAYVESIDRSERNRFETEMRNLGEVERGEVKETGNVVETVVDAVLKELVARDVRVVLRHEAKFEFSPRRVELYSFLRSPTTERIDQLGVSESVESSVYDGVELLSEEAFNRAAEQFERAVDAKSGSGVEMITLRLLAGWAHFCAGNDRLAADLADEVMNLDLGTWEGKLLWIVATSRFPDEIREGKYSVAAVLKWISTVPENGSLSVAVGFGDGTDVTWNELDTNNDFDILNQLAPYTHVRFRLAGNLSSLPQLQGYNLATALVNNEIDEIESVDRVFYTGPQGIGATETLAFTR